jgi:uncharacterized membrane protein
MKSSESVGCRKVVELIILVFLSLPFKYPLTRHMFLILFVSSLSLNCSDTRISCIYRHYGSVVYLMLPKSVCDDR